MSTASFAQSTPTDLPILILNGEKDPVVAETVADAEGQAQSSIVLNGVGHGHLVDLFVEHVGCTDVAEVLYPQARHEVLAELDDVKQSATAEILAFVERVCGEDSVVSHVLFPVATVVPVLQGEVHVQNHGVKSVCPRLTHCMRCLFGCSSLKGRTTASARWGGVLLRESSLVLT